MRNVDPSTVASAIGEITGLLAAGESVTISIFKNGPEPEAPSGEDDAPRLDKDWLKGATLHGSDAVVGTMRVGVALPRFDLDQEVALTMSGERGIIVGLAHYTERPPCFYVRYVAADGRQVEEWRDEGALTEVERQDTDNDRPARPSR